MNYSHESIYVLERLLFILVVLDVVPNNFTFFFPNFSMKEEWMNVVRNYCEKFNELKRAKDALNLLQQSHQPILAPELLELKYRYQNPSSFEVDSS